jgi:hypothetical protein
VFRLDITPEQAAALIVELQTLISANISHSGIAAPIAAGLEHGAPYLAMEYAVGDSLDVFLRDRGVLSVNDAAPLVDSLAAAIDHAASHGVHHGALHPRDIIMSAEGARITGFGVASAVERIGAKVPTRPAYSSPDAPSDTYSLAAIAFEAITGKRISPANIEEFRMAHGRALRGALAATLGVLSAAPHAPIASAFAPVEPGATADKPIAPLAPQTASPKPALDLRIDHPMELLPQPASVLNPVEDGAGSRRGRWQLVAVSFVLAAVAALSVAFFLRSRTAVPEKVQKTGVEETTVDLPASPHTSAAPASKATLPAPTPSRSASGALVPPQPTRGRMLIRSTPADADVLLNGGTRGKTPLVVRDLALGSYTIRVARDGYISESRTLELTSQRPTASATFNLRSTPASTSLGAVAGKPGAITVQSRPTGARVFVNDRLMGSTPATIPDLPAGPATVRIEMDGYQTWATRVRVGAGEQLRVAASLERR